MRLLLALLLLVLTSCARIPSPGEALKAPSFSLKTIKGEVIELRDFEGRRVLLNFWSTRCPYCIYEMPLLERAWRETDVIFIGISLDRDEEAVRELVSKIGITFYIGLDRGAIADKYGVGAIPASFLIDEEGRIKRKRVGAFANSEEVFEFIKP